MERCPLVRLELDRKIEVPEGAVLVALLQGGVAALDEQFHVGRLEAERLIVILHRAIEFLGQRVEQPSSSESLGALLRRHSAD